MCCNRLLFSVAASSPSRSGMLAGCAMTTSRFPWVPTKICRLRPVTFFPHRSPAPLRLQCLHTLTVDDPGTRLRFASHSQPCPLAQHIIDPDKGAIEAPVIEVVAHGIPVREVRGEQPPPTLGAVRYRRALTTSRRLMTVGRPTCRSLSTRGRISSHCSSVRSVA